MFLSKEQMRKIKLKKFGEVLAAAALCVAFNAGLFYMLFFMG